MRRQEFAHHTPEQIRGYFREALKIIEDVEGPEWLDKTMFGKAVDLLAAKTVQVEQPGTVPVDLGNLLRK